MKKILIILVMLVSLVACNKEEKKIVIAEQYGLAYAPVQIMMAKGYLEEALPDYEIQWAKLGNTMAIREAMTADALDAAFLGIPPYIIGTDAGMEWGLFTGLSRAPLSLMGREEGTLETIKDGRIALPQPGSIQHILLSMAAERSFADATVFDNQLVTMKHPDGMQVLINGNEVDYHFTSPPYVFQEAEAGMHEIISGEACFGGQFTFIVGVTNKSLKEDDMAYQALSNAINKSIDFIKENPEETLDTLTPLYNLDREVLRSYIYDFGIVYEKDIKGIETFVDFMYRNDYIKNEYTEEELIW
ncbi:ABC transporter substrate-binding protein [Acidaminobacter sp. JC074]|uniref:ABC transporter substrate-binding protein n=1 Tax=Acidaminobacter sp. JC074 TaxID=2530199 RepID=UPI001F11843C|nr:ABC transporter substrate-binding protein [Acidaminobacter sp. JC074]MCH4888440.1 ABC transporter substrate-binding protein [Acidaminobacter sp. JC074]